MKAFKGCTNDNCKAYKKIHYKKDDEFCSKCGESLNYVCADCWMILETNSNRYCISCKAKRDQKMAKGQDAVLKVGGGVAAVAVGAVAVADQVKEVAKEVIKNLGK